jgi:hypothetical protein
VKGENEKNIKVEPLILWSRIGNPRKGVTKKQKEVFLRNQKLRNSGG